MKAAIVPVQPYPISACGVSAWCSSGSADAGGAWAPAALGGSLGDRLPSGEVGCGSLVGRFGRAFGGVGAMLAAPNFDFATMLAAIFSPAAPHRR